MRRISACLITGIAIHGTAFARPPVQFFNIQQGSLGSAMIAIGRQSSVSIAILDSRLAARRVRGLTGRMSAEAAARRIAMQAGARLVRIDDTTFRVVASSPPAPRYPREAAKPRPAPISAERRDDDRGPAIVVVGSRRGLSLGRYAGQVVRLTADDLDHGTGPRGSEALEDATPLVFSTHLGPGRNKLFLRGIADSSFLGPTRSTIAQYFGEARINFAGPDPDLELFDIASVEILPGPEAALYGSGALAGVIRIEPARPDPDRVAVKTSAGFTVQRSGEPGYDVAGSLNLPIVEGHAAARIVAYRSIDGGYIDAILPPRTPVNRLDPPPPNPPPPTQAVVIRDANRTETHGARLLLSGDLDSDWRFDAFVLGQEVAGDDAQYATRSEPPLSRSQLLRQPYRDRYVLGNVAIRHDAKSTHFVASGSISHQSVDQLFDASQFGQLRAYSNHLDYRMASLDVRAWSDRIGRIDWLVGASILSEGSNDERAFDPAEEGLTGTLRIEQVDAAIYGEASIPLGPAVQVQAGLRTGLSHVSGTRTGAPQTGAATSNARYAVPSIRLAWQPSKGRIAYLRYEEGFRPAGFGIFGATVERFRPDRMRTLEAGGRLGEQADRFSASSALSITSWKDIQADTLDLSNLPTTLNIGDGWIGSWNGDLHWRPSTDWNIEAALSLNRSRLTRRNPSVVVPPRSVLPNVASIDARLFAQYELVMARHPASLFANARYVGRSRLGAGPILGKDQGPWFILDAGARIHFGRSALSLAVGNVLNSVSDRFALGTPFKLLEQDQFTPLRPRNLRLGWDADF